MKYWKSKIALAIMPLAFYFGFTEFYFALLVLIWSIIGFRNRNIYLLDFITERDNPTLFWIITIIWLGLSVWSLANSELIMWLLNFQKSN